MRKLLAAVTAVLLLLGATQPAWAAPGDVTSVISFGYEQTRHRNAENVSWWWELDEDSEAGVSYSQLLFLPEADSSVNS